jgi:hypothetical protein
MLGESVFGASVLEESLLGLSFLAGGVVRPGAGWGPAGAEVVPPVTDVSLPAELSSALLGALDPEAKFWTKDWMI